MVYRVTVEDHGAGVPDDELDKNIYGVLPGGQDALSDVRRIWARLAIARRGIALHGGRIHADNTASGLRVSVQLPPDIAAPGPDKRS